MKLIIAGSREFTNYGLLCEFLENANLKDITHVISGTARGADELGEKWAEDKGIEVISKPAQWDTYGKSAGHRRNAEMSVIGDILVAFWDGESRGTAGMIECMHKLNKPYYVCRVDML
jgi:hypothetical protein